MKLIFISDNLIFGGISRVLVNLINELVDRDYDVTLLLLTEKGELVDELHKNVKIVCLHKTRSRYAIVKLINHLRENNYDRIISATDQGVIVSSIAAMLTRNKKKLIHTQHENITERIKTRNWSRFKTRFYLMILKNSFMISSKIVTVSEGVRIDLIELIPNYKNKIKTIYNPIVNNQLVESISIKDVPPEIIDIRSRDNNKIIVSAGRLVKDKGFSDLIRAFYDIHKEINVILVILGEGPELDSLEKLTKNLGIEEKVKFLGFKTNPYIYFKNSDMYVLSSWSEGFGNVIVEAMICEIPVVSTDCKSGPNEIISNNVNGILVPPKDIVMLGKMILMVLSDEKLNSKLRQNGYERAFDFTIAKATNEYIKLLKE